MNAKVTQTPIGRLALLVGVAAAFAIFSLASGIAPSIPFLMAARLLLGVTIGISVVVVPVFVAESAPTRVRGAFLVLYQVATVVGIILGYLVAMGLSATGSWRWMLGLAAIPGAIITIVLLKLPDTAHWYVPRDRIDDARKTIRRLEGDGADVEKEIEAITGSFQTAHASRWRDLFRGPYLRATIFVIGLGFFVQITGINAIVYYSPRIFEAMGFVDDVQKLGMSALVQVVGLVAVFIALLVIDRMGRRKVLLTGIATMVIANALMVTVFALGGDKLDESQVVLGFVGLALFTAGFTFGFGSLVWVYAGEAMPAHLRAMGASIMLTANLTANAIIGATFLPVMTALGGAMTFVLLGGVAVLAFIFVAAMAPETKGRPLDDIAMFWQNGGK